MSEDALLKIAGAIHELAHEVSYLGNAGAVNTGEGGQGAIEVLGYKVNAGMQEIADAMTSIAGAIDNLAGAVREIRS